MKNQTRIFLCLLAIIFLFTYCQEEKLAKGSTEHLAKVTGAIDDEVLRNADARPGDWLTYGSNYQEDRYSKLDQINKENVKNLGLAWTMETGTKRGFQGTPLAVDGILFFSGEFNKVWAVDARTGEEIWHYRHDYNTDKNSDLCCGFSNRGLAIYQGDLLMGTLDGKLVSLNAATGTKNWEVMTIPENSNYSITGAPRIANGMVLIGNGGGELNGVRGYVTAYDAKTGDQKWRFYTVPGDPDKPYEHPDLEEAAKTWTGDSYWKQGGGGTAWDAITYDPELNQVYIGTGNGTHWDRQWRSPEGGDNLYLSSIVAVDADDGSYKWHFQTTPGDSWDYTATQHIVQADIEIDGRQRKVLMQAPKNGYFYVIDRTNGEFISGDNFVYQNWTTGLDENGRPIEAPGARYDDGQAHYIAPSSHGGHNWPPMAYNYEKGLMFIPTAQESEPYYHFPNIDDPRNTGAGIDGIVSLNNKLYVPTVFDPNPNAPAPMTKKGRLIAWDPVQQQEVWGVDQTAHFNGGLLTTTTGLLMQGDALGMFSIRDVDNGEVLKQFDLRSGISASPVTYMVDGEQYITILVGYGGAMAARHGYVPNNHTGTVYTFKLNGNAEMPEKLQPEIRQLTALRNPEATPVDIGNGWSAFTTYCIACHPQPGTGDAANPDLARSPKSIFDNYDKILLEGALASQGMPAFADQITKKEIEDIKSFLFYTSEQLSSGTDFMAYLTEVAKMQYVADQQAQIKN